MESRRTSSVRLPLPIRSSHLWLADTVDLFVQCVVFRRSSTLLLIPVVVGRRFVFVNLRRRELSRYRRRTSDRFRWTASAAFHAVRGTDLFRCSGGFGRTATTLLLDSVGGRISVFISMKTVHRTTGVHGQNACRVTHRCSEVVVVHRRSESETQNLYETD